MKSELRIWKWGRDKETMVLRDTQRIGKDEEEMTEMCSQTRISILASPQLINWPPWTGNPILFLCPNGSRSLIFITQEAHDPGLANHRIIRGHVTQAGPSRTLPWDLYIVLKEILSMWKSLLCSRKESQRQEGL